MPLPALLLPLLGGALGAGIDLALQLLPSEKPSRISWGSVALGGVLGVLPGAALSLTSARLVAPAAARQVLTRQAYAQAVTQVEQVAGRQLAPLAREAIRAPGSAAEAALLGQSPRAADALAAARTAEELAVRATTREVLAEGGRAVGTGAAAWPILDHDPLPPPPAPPRSKGLAGALGGD